jgi:hypothetical protein
MHASEKHAFSSERYDLRENFYGTFHLNLKHRTSSDGNDRYRIAWSICIAAAVDGCVRKMRSSGRFAGAQYNTREPPAKFQSVLHKN